MKYFGLLFLLMTLTGCNASKLLSSGDLSSVQSNGGYIDNNSKIRIYVIDPAGLLPIGELKLAINQAKLPNSIYDGPYGNRNDPSLPQPYNLLIKVYTPGFSYEGIKTGDFYFETPILHSSYEVSNVTTALSWVLMYSYDRNDFLISKNMWDAMRQGVEVFCQDCRKKTNTAVLNLILQNQEFTRQMTEALGSQNPGVAPVWMGFNPPQSLMVHMEPAVGINRRVPLTAAENDRVSLTSIFVSPLNSTEQVAPIRWSHHEPTGEVDSQDGGTNYAFRFSYAAAGDNYVKATNGTGGSAVDYFFDFGVSNTDRSPVWDENIELTMTANRVNSVNISGYCTDPDPLNTLSFSWVSGPPGLIVLSNGSVSWKPVQTSTGASQVGDWVLQVQCSDDDIQRLSTSANITIHVLPDNLPTFDPATPTNWVVQEGVPSTFTVTVFDLDSDPLALEVVDTSDLRSGLPAGSGVFRVLPPVVTGNQSVFTIEFTPSFLQALGSDRQINVTLNTHYSSDSGQYDAVSSIVKRPLALDVTNMDDPPQWLGSPADQDIAESVTFGPFAIVGAIDPSPSSSAITYSLDSAPNNCEWPFTVDPATGTLSGTPDLTSSRSCTFRLAATDASGLTSFSDYFTYLVANDNHPVLARVGALTTYSTIERQPLLYDDQPIDLLTLFEDADEDAGDSYERIFYKCLNCVALGVTNFSMNTYTNSINWTPVAGAWVNSPYAFQIEATDEAGTVANVTINVTVTRGPTEVLLTAVAPGMTMDLDDDTSDSMTSAHLTINENLGAPVATSLQLTVAPASSDPTDHYTYSFSAPISCSRIGGGTCRAAMITAPASIQGDGSLGPDDFFFNISPNATDGDSALPNDSSGYVLTFQVTKDGDALLATTFTLYLEVKNVNRSPTQIGVGNLNASAGPYTYGAGTLTLPVIDASQDVKNGSSWQKNYRFPFDPVDPDGANDTANFQFVTNGAPGTFTGRVWSFKIPSCLSAGTNQATKTYTLRMDDGRGGTVTRDLKITYRNIALPPPSCL